MFAKVTETTTYSICDIFINYRNHEIKLQNCKKHTSKVLFMELKLKLVSSALHRNYSTASRNF